MATLRKLHKHININKNENPLHLENILTSLSFSWLLAVISLRIFSRRKAIMVELDIPPETTTEFLIRVGLYISAIFQLTCILAIIVLPDKSTEGYGNRRNTEVSDHESWEPPPNNLRHTQHRVRKQDKKKRR